MKTSSAISPVVSLARIGEISSEKSSKYIQINKNSRKCNWNIGSIDEPMSPKMARSTGKTKRLRQKDVSNNYSEMVVETSRKLNYCDNRSPKNTSSLFPKKLKHGTDAKGANAATFATEDDLEVLINSPSLPSLNHVTLSPTVILKRLDSSRKQAFETENREESGEENTSDQSESRIDEPMTPRMARSSAKTKASRRKDVSNNSEMVVNISRRLSYCDHRSPVGPKKMEHSTDGKGTNAAASTTEDDLEVLINSPSLPSPNHVTLSPTVILKRLDSSRKQTFVTKNREESGEENTSDQSESRTSFSSSSSSIKRKLLRTFERNMKRRKKGKNAKDLKKPFSLETRNDQSQAIRPVTNQKKKKKSLHAAGTSGASNKCNETQSTFTSGLLAEWGTLPKSTRIQQKMLEEIERGPGEVGTTGVGCSPYNRVFSLPCPLPSPSAGRTLTTKRRPGFAQTSPLVGKQVHIQ